MTLKDSAKANNYNLTNGSVNATGTIAKASQTAPSITGLPTGTITYGDSFTLHTEGGVSWSASGAAAVDSSGKVTVTGTGKVTITATKPGDNNHYSAEDQITFDELTAPMLNEFIEKVVVHEADKSTGDRRQKVDIYFNFIGCFVPPKPEVILTAEEEAKAQKALAARNREREQNKLRMRRVREAQRAAKVAEKVSFPVG